MIQKSSSLSVPAILNVALFLFFPLAVFAPKGIAVLFSAVAVCTVFGYWKSFRESFLKIIKQPIIMGIGALIVWSYASSLWSVDPGNSLFSAAQLMMWGVCGVCVTAAFETVTGLSKCRARWYFVVGMGAGLILLTLEYVTNGFITRFFTGFDFSITRLNRAATVLSLLAFPFLWILWTMVHSLSMSRKIGIFGILYAWIFLLLFSLDCDTAKVAFWASTAVFAVVLWRQKWAAWGMMGLLGLVIMTAPLGPKTLLKPDFFVPIAQHFTQKFSFYHRIYIYDFVAKKIDDHPVIGWGFDGARHASFAVEKRPHLMAPEQDMPLVPIHPHNAALQVWLELGFVGAALFCFILLCLPWMILRRGKTKSDGAAAFSALTSGLISAFVSFGIWQHWWLSSLWFAALIVGGVLADDTESRDHEHS